MFPSIAKKIKYFRKRQKVKQSYIERLMKSPAGFISKIENGKINPSRETILKIASILGINNREVEYLIGESSYPVDLDRINEIQKLLRGLQNPTNRLIFILDDRGRLIEFSNEIGKLFGKYTNYKKAEVLLKPFIEILVNEKYQLNRLLNPQKLEESLTYFLYIYYSEVSFMELEEEVYYTLMSIRKSQTARKLWENYIKKSIPDLGEKDGRSLHLTINGENKSYEILRDIIPGYPRFSQFELVDIK